MYDTYARYIYISIHALRGEGDDLYFSGFYNPVNFNPRPPWGGRLFGGLFGSVYCDFNPRPPWGGRPIAPATRCRHNLFQSTPSVGRATGAFLAVNYQIVLFQSTPSVGRATIDANGYQRSSGFQSTPSVGRATFCMVHFYIIHLFQSTPSVGRATV